MNTQETFQTQTRVIRCEQIGGARRLRTINFLWTALLALFVVMAVPCASFAQAALTDDAHVKCSVGDDDDEAHESKAGEAANSRSGTGQCGSQQKLSLEAGWHTHPGPSLISVTSGTITAYDSDDPSCTPHVNTAGTGFVDAGEHAHLLRNEGGVPAVTVATQLLPPGAVRRIDAPSPGNCPF